MLFRFCINFCAWILRVSCKHAKLQSTMTAHAPTPSTHDPLNFGCLKQKWSEIRIRSPVFTQIWLSAGSLPKCSGFIPLSASVRSPSFGDCMINPKISSSAILQEVESDPESVSAAESSPTVNQLFRSVGPIVTPVFINEIGWYFCSNPSDRRTHKSHQLRWRILGLRQSFYRRTLS